MLGQLNLFPIPKKGRAGQEWENVTITLCDVICENSSHVATWVKLQNNGNYHHNSNVFLIYSL